MAIVADSFGQLQNFRFQLPQLEQRNLESALEARRAEENARNARIAAVYQADMENRSIQQNAVNNFNTMRAADVRDMRDERYRSALAKQQNTQRMAEIGADRAYADEQQNRQRLQDVISAMEFVDNPADIAKMFPNASPAILSAAMIASKRKAEEKSRLAEMSSGVADVLNRSAEFQDFKTTAGEDNVALMKSIADKVAAKQPLSRYEDALWKSVGKRKEDTTLWFDEGDKAYGSRVAAALSNIGTELQAPAKTYMGSSRMMELVSPTQSGRYEPLYRAPAALTQGQVQQQAPASAPAASQIPAGADFVYKGGQLIKVR